MNIHALATLLGVLALSAPIPATRRQSSQQCTGHECTADATLTMGAPLGWSIETITKDGKGRNAEFPCAPCKFCKFTTVWSYDGNNGFNVQWGENQVGGFFQGSGTITTYMECDEITETITFATGGSSAGQLDLICPCN